jgi:bifunctional non-homologous end joining protein LigD
MANLRTRTAQRPSMPPSAARESSAPHVAPIEHIHLALLVDRARPFSAPGWIFELKYDGYRCLARVEDGNPQLISRQGWDMSGAFPELTVELATLPEGTAIDGELVMLDQNGHPQFDELMGRAAVSRRDSVARASRTRPGAIFAWDLLMYAGEDMRNLPLVARKDALDVALAGLKRINIAAHVHQDGERLYKEAEFLELEGIVAKRADSTYKAGRTEDWLKIKTPIGREREARRMEHRRS